MNASAEFDVFVSYNSLDHAAVERLARALTVRGLSVFLDRWELVPGRSWPEALEGHLARCRRATVVLGPSGMGAWQHREHYLALDRQARDRSFGVVPVLLPGADPALGFLSLNTWVDLRGGVDDPLAMDLLAAALRGQPPSSLLEQSRRATAEVCPYRGLEVFREEDAPFFFGRETFTQRLLERVAARDFVAVVGASGSGKSSVVRAGLVPELRQGTDGTVWDVLALAPGAEPLAALSRAIDPPPATGLIAARAHLNAAAAKLREGEVTLRQLVGDHLVRQPGTDRLLLIVDQLEELVTLGADGGDQKRFVDLLLEATGEGGALSVLLTLRSDFYTQLVRRRDLNDRLQDAVVHIGPLSRTAPEGGLSELESIVRRPAKTVGLDFEDGLVPRILADVGEEPGNLPLLEYLLTELWRRRGRGLLTHEAYESLGGVQGAIARRADEAFEGLAPAQQRAARRLFLSLVRPGEGQQDTRAPAPFPDDPLEVEVARRFSGPKVRLLVADDDPLQGRIVEVSHEALIRNWSRLRQWIDQNRETLRVRERVRQRMRRWQEKDERADLLLPPGLELEEGRRVLETDTDVPIDEVRGYIEQSIAAEETRIAEREARQEAERQRELAAQRQKRRLVSSALAVSLLLLALAGWQWWRAENGRVAEKAARTEAQAAQLEAERQTARANAEADIAVAREWAAKARKVLEENPGETSVAAMIAMDSLRRRLTPQANAVLREALALTPLDIAPVSYPWGHATALASDNGEVIVFSRLDSSDSSKVEPQYSRTLVLNRDDLSRRGEHRVEGLGKPVLSPDGRWLVITGNTRELLIEDLSNGELVVREQTRSNADAVFAPDGQTLYAARPTGEIEVREAPDWSVARQMSVPVETVGRNIGIEITPDGQTLLAVLPRQAVFVLPTGGGPVAKLEIPVDPRFDEYVQPTPVSVTVAPSGALAVTGHRRGEARLWDLESRRKIATLKTEKSCLCARPVLSTKGLMLSSHESATAQGGRIADIVPWSAADGGRLERWSYPGEVEVLAIAANETRIAAAGARGLALWEPGRADPVAPTRSRTSYRTGPSARWSLIRQTEVCCWVPKMGRSFGSIRKPRLSWIKKIWAFECTTSKWQASPSFSAWRKPPPGGAGRT